MSSQELPSYGWYVRRGIKNAIGRVLFPSKKPQSEDGQRPGCRESAQKWTRRVGITAVAVLGLSCAGVVAGQIRLMQAKHEAQKSDWYCPFNVPVNGSVEGTLRTGTVNKQTIWRGTTDTFPIQIILPDGSEYGVDTYERLIDRGFFTAPDFNNVPPGAQVCIDLKRYPGLLDPSTQTP